MSYNKITHLHRTNTMSSITNKTQYILLATLLFSGIKSFSCEQKNDMEGLTKFVNQMSSIEGGKIKETKEIILAKIKQKEKELEEEGKISSKITRCILSGIETTGKTIQQIAPRALTLLFAVYVTKDITAIWKKPLINIEKKGAENVEL